MTTSTDRVATVLETTVPGSPRRHELPRRGAAAEAVRVGTPHPDGSPQPARRVVAGILQTTGLIALGFVLALSVVGHLRYGRQQHLAYSALRQQLATGVAPLGAVDTFGHVVPPGAPVAVLEIPSLHRRVVVLQGTTSRVLMGGPGHLRSTVLPGQAGTSVVLGRRAGYGAPFQRLASLRPGDVITTVTGQGRSSFRVERLRRSGDLLPAVPAGQARLTLATAEGAAFAPSGVLWVDALSTTSFPAHPQVAALALSADEAPMRPDRSGGLGLLLAGQALVLLSLAVVYLRQRWGRWQTWIVTTPALLALSVVVADHVARLLPNLL